MNTEDNNVETALNNKLEEYKKYLDCTEESIRAAFLDLVRADFELSVANSNMNAAMKAKDSQLTPEDLEILGAPMQPKAMQEKIAQIQKARELHYQEMQEIVLFKQYEFRQIGIIVDGIKQIVANRRVCAND